MDIYSILEAEKTYKRKMFSFMTAGEISRMKKVETVRQTKPKATMGSHVENFIKEKTVERIYNV